MKPIAIITVLILGLVHAWPALSAENPEARIMAVPRFEAEQVVAGWLKRGGYQVSSRTGADSVTLFGASKTSGFTVVLRHHSPMASEISVESKPPEKAQELWKYLGGYLQGYSTNHGAARGSGETLQDIPPRVAPMTDLVVCIQASSEGRPTQLSGFVVDSSGLILCTAHTLKKPNDIIITLVDGHKYPGRLVKIDFMKDLALIDCSHAFPRSIAMNGSGDVPDMGQRVYTIGCPLNNRGTVSSGYVDGPVGIVQGQPLLQVKMEVEPGSSGSPVFDAEGRLVAVVKGRLKGGGASGLLIPMDTIISFVREK